MNSPKKMKKKSKKPIDEEKQINNLRFLYLKGSPQAIKFARRQLVNVFGFDDDYIPGYDDGEMPAGEIKK